MKEAGMEPVAVLRKKKPVPCQTSDRVAADGMG
jgi:hypothetical protein